MNLPPQLRTFRTIVKWLFTAAGLYWIFIYGLDAADLITHDELTVLRGGQTVIYFILLTLWGVDYMREAKVLRRVLQNGGDISQTVYPVLTGTVGNATSWILPLLNSVGILASSILIIKQYVVLFSYSVN